MSYDEETKSLSGEDDVLDIDDLSDDEDALDDVDPLFMGLDEDEDIFQRAGYGDEEY
jgi:hypothetical protein